MIVQQRLVTPVLKEPTDSIRLFRHQPPPVIGTHHLLRTALLVNFMLRSPAITS